MMDFLERHFGLILGVVVVLAFLIPAAIASN
jgi:hypothetical protein